MKQEIIAAGKTVEAAISNGAATLGVDTERITYEIIEQPKKGFLGFGETPAKVKIIYLPAPEDMALGFVRKLLENMQIEATADIGVDKDLGSANRIIRITGDPASVLIGHHGDTLESLQILVNLIANRKDDENYTKITVDIGSYRAKREQTLRRLARGMASKVLKYRKSITLEPMNPYERRIIHSEIQDIKGVTTTSIGADNNRRVVIFLDEKNKRKPPQPKEGTAAKE
ncbi:MAG: protein jag [Oscillospiraceae bacterium]|nr:protein jag [Oscillospiraceae bacterium]